MVRACVIARATVPIRGLQTEPVFNVRNRPKNAAFKFVLARTIVGQSRPKTGSPQAVRYSHVSAAGRKRARAYCFAVAPVVDGYAVHERSAHNLQSLH